MAKQAFTVKIKAEGVRETLRAFRDLPEDAHRELRTASLELAQTLVPKIKAGALSAPTPQAELAAGTVRAVRDRVPVILAGGSKRVGRNKVPVWKVLFGSEFGSNAYGQFHHAHTGRAGLWFFPVVEKESSEVIAAWRKAADAIVRRFAGVQLREFPGSGPT